MKVGIKKKITMQVRHRRYSTAEDAAGIGLRKGGLNLRHRYRPTIALNRLGLSANFQVGYPLLFLHPLTVKEGAVKEGTICSENDWIICFA